RNGSGCPRASAGVAPGSGSARELPSPGSGDVHAGRVEHPCARVARPPAHTFASACRRELLTTLHAVSCASVPTGLRTSGQATAETLDWSALRHPHEARAAVHAG